MRSTIIRNALALLLVAWSFVAFAGLIPQSGPRHHPSGGGGGGDGDTIITVDFQDSAPFQAVGTNGNDNLTAWAAAPTGQWNYTHVTGGGYGGANYVRYEWVDFSVSGDNDSSFTGFTIPSSIGKPGSGWPTNGPFCMRFRIKVETPITGSGNEDMKFAGWHAGVFDGDERVIMHVFTGSSFSSGQSNAAGIQLSLERNINHTTEAARIFVPADETWHHVQMCWRHGASGTSYLRAYLDNNDEENPTAEDTTETTWLFDSAGYDGDFSFGLIGTDGSETDPSAFFQFQDLELGLSFKSGWAP